MSREPSEDAQYFMDKADECMRLVQAARDTARALESMAQSFWARAVELDSARDRAAKRSRGA